MDDLFIQAIVRDCVVHPVAALQIELSHDGEADRQLVATLGLPAYMPYMAPCCSKGITPQELQMACQNMLDEPHSKSEPMLGRPEPPELQLTNPSPELEGWISLGTLAIFELEMKTSVSVASFELGFGPRYDGTFLEDETTDRCLEGIPWLYTWQNY
ncbi:uncharacterized protein KY384_004497 [Bacidia gigantensis]|uniref:uncharacterized protein n=1 Tax=Bacidia gigantensis TaxID=2732470 RepID=UPI001D04583E|nr:uncharacterized protein KY384_004497 [Bacidia gigantensis]KAG8531139.1 hypothetical protein KY384_004497 [Bacidia gigantensis]